MKKLYNVGLVGLWMVLGCCFLNAQTMPVDTTLGNTDAAAKAATWLKNLSLPSGKGSIAVLSGFSAQALLRDTSRKYVNSTSMSSYYSSSLFQQDLQSMRSTLLQRMVFARKLGALFLRDPATFAWGVLEPAKGTYTFTLIDSLIKISGDYGVPFIGTIVPFSDWASSCNKDQSMYCSNLFSGNSGADYFFINQNKTGPVCDTSAFYNFVQKIVERYDGDGVDDMPGLKVPITYWEFSNEPDGACGGYGDIKYANGQQSPNSLPGMYSRDHSIAYRAVKSACPTCKVANGGAIESFDVRFWNSILDTLLPNARYLDIGNIHLNDGKSVDAASWKWDADLYRYYNLFQANITKYKVKVPIWVTEWGFYSGSPSVQGMGGTTTKLTNRTEEEQASIYAKFYLWGKANNVTTFVYDFMGGDGTLTSAALIQSGMTGMKARLSYHTLRLLEHKFRDIDSATQVSFTTSANLSLPSGHIRLYKKGVATDVAWGLTALPTSITGRKVVTDMYGNTDTTDVSKIALPLGVNPVIIESATTTDILQDNVRSVSIYPNPASGLLTLTGDLSAAAPLRLELSDIMGTTVLQHFYGMSTGLFTKTLDVSQLPQGLYTVRIHLGIHTKTLPLLIVR